MKFLILFFSILIFISCKSNQPEPVSNSLALNSVTKEVSIKTDSIIRNAEISGEVQRIKAFPSKYLTSRTVDIWLPEDYSENKKYAVLYMNDGQNLFDPEPTNKKMELEVDEIITKLTSEGSLKATIVVGIHNIPRKRHDDYFPKKPFEALPVKVQDSLKKIAKAFNMEITLNSENYLKFIVEELKPYIDVTYSTKTNRNETYIAGASMGGLISMYAVCEYPEIFGGAICMSTHWPGVIPIAENVIPPVFFSYMRENVPPPGTNKFYFDFGTKGMDRFYVKFEDEVNDIFKDKGYTSENFRNLKIEGGNHTEEYWRERLPDALLMMLGS